jgi:hypothetical protein
MEGWRNAPHWLDEYAARENWRPDKVADFAERFAGWYLSPFTTRARSSSSTHGGPAKAFSPNVRRWHG